MGVAGSREETTLKAHPRDTAETFEPVNCLGADARVTEESWRPSNRLVWSRSRRSLGCCGNMRRASEQLEGSGFGLTW